MLNCPFCGCKKIIEVRKTVGHGTTAKGLQCSNCSAQIYDDYNLKTGKTAKDKWERRVLVLEYIGEVIDIDYTKETKP